jgi:hypothetical protein
MHARRTASIAARPTYDLWRPPFRTRASICLVPSKVPTGRNHVDGLRYGKARVDGSRFVCMGTSTTTRVPITMISCRQRDNLAQFLGTYLLARQAEPSLTQ